MVELYSPCILCGIRNYVLYAMICMLECVIHGDLDILLCLSNSPAEEIFNVDDIFQDRQL